MPPPSVSRLWARGIFYRPHLLAFLDFYFFYYSQRLRTPGLALRAMKKQDILQGPWPSAPNKSLSTTVPLIFLIFAISGCKLLGRLSIFHRRWRMCERMV